MSEQVTFSKGLAGVIADASTICLINGEKGELYYRGYSIYDIAEHNATFDEVAYLLLNGSLPTADQLSAFSADLTARRAVPENVLTIIKNFPKDGHPMAALQTATISEAPTARASWHAARPHPPLAPMMRTFPPGRSPACSKSDW